MEKSIQNHESKMNEDSKALCVVTNKIIKDHDNELTKEEIDLIGSHLDKEIEDLNQHINNEKCTKTKNKYVSKELKSKIQKQINDYFERKYRYEFQKSILRIEIVILRQIMMRHL